MTKVIEIPVRLRWALFRAILYRIFQMSSPYLLSREAYRYPSRAHDFSRSRDHFYPCAPTTPIKKPNPSESNKTGKHIFLLRPDHIGDLIYSLPSILLIKQSMHSEDQLSILIDPCNLDIAKALKLFDNIYVFPLWHSTKGPLYPSKPEFEQLCRSIEEIDVLIDLKPESHFPIFPARIKARKTYFFQNPLQNLTDNEDLDTAENLFENPKKSNQFFFCSDKFNNFSRSKLLFIFISKVIANQNQLPPITFNDAVDSARKLLKQLFPQNRSDVIVFCPESRNPSKIWTAFKSQLLINYLVKNNRRFKIIGQNIYPKFKNISAISDLRSSTGLIEAMEHIASAKIFIGFDSGFSHFSGLIGIPTITIFTTGSNRNVFAATSVNDGVHIIQSNFILPSGKLWIDSHKILRYVRYIFHIRYILKIKFSLVDVEKVISKIKALDV